MNSDSSHHYLFPIPKCLQCSKHLRCAKGILSKLLILKEKGSCIVQYKHLQSVSSRFLAHHQITSTSPKIAFSVFNKWMQKADLQIAYQAEQGTVTVSDVLMTGEQRTRRVAARR